jgi:hypothetical protein
MNNKIILTADGRVYHCAACPYRNRLTGFCGFCMRKILDEMKMARRRAAEGGITREKLPDDYNC